jgi:SOS-response transcriptional repressor LexA
MIKLDDALKNLMAKHDITPSELSRQTGVGQSVIFRMISGETDNPKVATLSPIANYFGISINQLIGETPIANSEDEPKYPGQISAVPLLTFEQAKSLPKILKDKKIQKGIKTIFMDIALNKYIYALKLKDESMDPMFSKGTILIINLNEQPTDRDYAIIKLKNQNEVIFRQVLIDGKNHYLKPLSPDSDKFKMKLFAKGDKYLGTLAQARRNF